MKLALVGYGKMGKTLERLASTAGHEVAAIADSEQQLAAIDPRSVEVAIEFTQPDQVLSNIELCLDKGWPTVVGTTGWNDQLPQVEQWVSEKQGALFYASNFSLGVNVFLEVNRLLASYMNGLQGYEVSIDETHHTQKLDHPSGTAITLAETLLGELGNKSGWTEKEAEAKEKILIRHHRRDPVPGIHETHFRSEVDEITLRHSANNREGFAKGALAAAGWLPSRQGLFTMKDLMPSLLSEKD